MPQTILSHHEITKLCRELISAMDRNRRYLLREACYAEQDGAYGEEDRGADSARRLREAARGLADTIVKAQGLLA